MKYKTKIKPVSAKSEFRGGNSRCNGLQIFIKRRNATKRFIGDIASIKAGGDCPQEWSKYKTKDCQIPIYSNGTDNEGLYGYTKEPTILKRGITVAARGTIGYCTMRNGGYVPIIRLLAVTPNDIGGDVYYIRF